MRSRVDLPLPIFPVKTNQLRSFIFRLTLSNKTLSLIFKEKLSKLDNVDNIEINIQEKTIVVEGTTPKKDLQAALVETNFKIV